MKLKTHPRQKTIFFFASIAVLGLGSQVITLVCFLAKDDWRVLPLLTVSLLLPLGIYKINKAYAKNRRSFKHVLTLPFAPSGYAAPAFEMTCRAFFSNPLNRCNYEEKRQSTSLGKSHSLENAYPLDGSKRNRLP